MLIAQLMFRLTVSPAYNIWSSRLLSSQSDVVELTAQKLAWPVIYCCCFWTIIKNISFVRVLVCTHSASEAVATMRYINLCFTYLLTCTCWNKWRRNIEGAAISTSWLWPIINVSVNKMWTEVLRSVHKAEDRTCIWLEMHHLHQLKKGAKVVIRRKCNVLVTAVCILALLFWDPLVHIVMQAWWEVALCRVNIHL